MDTPLFRRKVQSALRRLGLARAALASGGRVALDGLKASLDFSGAKASHAPNGATRAAASDVGTAFALTLARLHEAPPPQTQLTSSKPKRVVMMVVSQLRIDPRVEREARALAARGFEVVVIAPDVSEPTHAERPLDWGERVKIEALPAPTSQFINTAPWFCAPDLVRAGLAHDAFAYHAHDLWTALAALDCASQTGAFAVTDFHEWASENVCWDDAQAKWVPHPPAQADAFRSMEIIALRRAALRITVNATIARALERMANLPNGAVSVVRNIPSLGAIPTRAYLPLKQQLGLPETSVAILYQGGTGPSRLLEPVIKSLAHLPSHVVLVIRGPSLDLYADHYRRVAREAGVEQRVILRDAVPSGDVVAAAKGADIGIWTLPDLSLNFRYALPNKIFEYLAAGLPIAVADYPEAAKIALTYECGETFDPDQPKDIAAALTRLMDPGVRLRYGQNALNALKALEADKEWGRFSDLYEDLWSRNGVL